MNPPAKPPLRGPTFLEGVIGSAIPLAVAIVVILVAGFLAYLFWFGFDGIGSRLSR